MIWDRIGIIISSVCLVHCLLVPFILMLFPFVESKYDHFHELLTIFVVVPAFLAFIPGYKKHRNINVLYLAVTGLIFIMSAAFLEDIYFSHNAARIVTILGSLFMILAHARNIKHAHQCRTCHH